MNSLVIDYDEIADKQTFLTEIPTKTTSKLFIVLIIPQHKIEKMFELNGYEDRVSFLNTEGFRRCIRGYTWLSVNDNLCEISKPTDKFDSFIVESIDTTLPKISKITINIPINNKEIIQRYCKCHFGNPRVNGDFITLTRDKHIKKDFTNEIEYVFQNIHRDYCTISAKLDEDTVKYLKNLCFDGMTKNRDGTTSQKEMAGNMYIKHVDRRLNHTVEVNKKSVITGKEFDIDIVEGLYNFHSHPKNAYKEYNVKLGWPSAQDYVGFLLAIREDNTVFHMVITLEGIYILSLSKDWSCNKDRLYNDEIIKIIKTQYDISYENGNTIKEYLKKVNKIKYEKKVLFNVQFLPWKNADKVFTLPYPKTKNNCIIKN